MESKDVCKKLEEIEKARIKREEEREKRQEEQAERRHKESMEKKVQILTDELAYFTSIFGTVSAPFLFFSKYKIL